MEDVTRDSVTSGIASLTGNDNHHGNEDHNSNEDGSGSKGGNVNDHRASLKASKLDETKMTLEPEGGNTTAEKLDGATIVSDPAEAQTL